MDLPYYKLIIILNQILIYTQKVESVNYTAILIRPDISFIYLKLLYYLKNPLSQHQKAVKKVLQYLWRTKNLILEFNDISFDINIFLVYFNAVFADIIDFRKSSVGYIF